MLSRNRPKYVILGAGISGLSLAWFLKKRNPLAEVIIVEKENSIGGWVQTEVQEGFLFEKGPHTLRLSASYKKTCLELFNDLNLTQDIIEPTIHHKKRYLAYDNRLHNISLKPLDFLKPGNFFKFTYPLLKSLSKKNTLPEDESIESFFKRYFGEHLTHYFADPLIMGIMGGDIKKLSIKSCFPLIDKLANQNNSLLIGLLKYAKKNPAYLLSFKNGLSQLINALKDKLNVEIMLNTPAIKLMWHPKPTVILSHQKIVCDHIFSTLPANQLAILFKDEDLQSHAFLSEQKAVSFKIAHIGCHQKLNIPKAFGFISPTWSKQTVSGVIFDSEVFPSQNKTMNQTRLTVMVHQDSSLFKKDNESFKEGILKELETLLKVSIVPHYFKDFLFNNAIPQYHINHQKSLDLLENELSQRYPNFSFLGNSFYGLSVPMCIHKAFEQSLTINTF